MTPPTSEPVVTVRIQYFPCFSSLLTFHSFPFFLPSHFTPPAQIWQRRKLGVTSRSPPPRTSERLHAGRRRSPPARSGQGLYFPILRFCLLFCFFLLSFRFGFGSTNLGVSRSGSIAVVVLCRFNRGTGNAEHGGAGSNCTAISLHLRP